MFKYLRSSLQTKVTIPLVRNKHGDLTSSTLTSAEELADVFEAAYSLEPPRLPNVLTGCPGTFLSEVEFTPDLVLKHLQQLNVSSSPGADGISARVLRCCASSLAKPLSILFDRSFSSHTLPNCWKTALITPIFKSGDKLNPKNYRPISLVPIAAKICERIILERVTQFALQNNLIPEEQHGFLPGRSVLTNLLLCVDEWSIMLDRGVPVDVIYLDFSRAFDRVPHKRLLLKLESLGIRGSLLQWIKSFLSDRSFRVRVGDSLSTTRPVLSGVPQGSVLGPILFLLYTSDLPRTIRSHCSLFADDSKIFGNPLIDPGVIQRDLDALYDWSANWCLPLNLQKCAVVHMGKNNPAVKYTLGGRVISSESSHCDLGVVVSNDLSWSNHILHVVSKAKRILYLLRRSFSRCDPTTCRILYTTYVRPILEYAGPVWAPSLVRDVELLESVQRRATRIPYGVLRPSYTDRLSIMNLPLFSERRIRGDLIITYRALNGLFSADLGRIYTLNNDERLRGHRFKLRREKFRSTQRECFLSNRVFSSWNRLPSTIVEASNVNSFKNQYDRWIQG